MSVLPNYCDIIRIDCSTGFNLRMKGLKTFSLDESVKPSLSNYYDLAKEQRKEFIRDDRDYSYLILDELEKGCENDNIIFYIAEWNNNICGFAKVEKYNGEIFIHSIVSRATPIKPFVQGKIGEKIIERIKDDFKRSHKYIKLYPIPTSIPFYKKMGFVSKDKIMFYYFNKT